jgi:hypothetical protein
MGFFSSPRQLLKGWELPLAGLLLTAGVAATATTLKTVASQQQAKAFHAVNSNTVLPSLETEASQEQEQAVDSFGTGTPSNIEAPQQQEQTLDSSVVTIPYEALAPQPQEQAIDASQEAIPSDETLLQPQEQAAKAPAAVTRPPEAAAPHKQELRADSHVAAMPATKWSRQAQDASKFNIAQAPNTSSSIADGTYLYGQTSQPGEIGKEYLVFEARRGKVVGAMYMPSSEFACFYGTLNAKQMNLMVANPYEQTAFSHTIAREQRSQVAAAGGQINLENTYDSLSYPHSVGLEGYQPINQVSDNDRQILNTCVSKYQAKAWN